MTFYELIHQWKKNINAEYIVPTLYDLDRDNIIISLEQPLVEVVKEIKRYHKKYKDELKAIKAIKEKQ